MKTFFKGVLVICFFVCSISTFSNAQNPILYSAGRYAGIHGVQLNPSALSFNKPYWSVTLGGGGINVQNNLLSLTPVAWPRLALGADLFIKADNARNRLNGPVTGDVIAQEHIDQPLLLQQSLWVMPLGITFQLGKHGFALSNQIRQELFVEGLAARAMRHQWEGILFEPLLDSTVSSPGLEFQFNMWNETSLSYSYRFLHSWSRVASVGISAKVLVGMRSMNFGLDQFKYLIREPDTARFSQFDGLYARSMGADATGSGLGMAFDIGFTYGKIDQYTFRRPQKRRGVRSFNFRRRGPVRKPAPDYLWKVGVSVLDLGLISYNAPMFDINSRADFSATKPFFDFSQRDFDMNFVGELQGNGQVNIIDGYTIGAPTALSVQFDGKLYEQFYFYAGIVQRMPIMGDFKMKRTNYLTAALRMEYDWAEVTLPMTLIEYNQLSIGLAGRIGPLMLGTDRFGELVGISRVGAADFYLAFNLFDFWSE